MCICLIYKLHVCLFTDSFDYDAENTSPNSAKCWLHFALYVLREAIGIINYRLVARCDETPSPTPETTTGTGQPTTAGRTQGNILAIK